MTEKEIRKIWEWEDIIHPEDAQRWEDKPDNLEVEELIKENARLSTYPKSAVNQENTVIDDDFSKNHETEEIQEVSSNSEMPGLIFAEIDNDEQNTFYLEVVGEMDGG